MRFLSILFLLFAFADAKIVDFKTIKSDFIQTVTNDQNKTIVYEGSFYATQEQKAIWIYTKPVEKKIYFSKSKVLIIEPELEQAIITNLENTPNIAELIRSAKETSPNHYVTRYMDTSYTIITEGSTIEKIHYKDKLENSVEIRFSNQSTNLFLDDELFKAQIPKGYDIVRE